MSAKENYIMIETARDLCMPVRAIKRLCRCRRYAVEHRDLCYQMNNTDGNSNDN